MTLPLPGEGRRPSGAKKGKVDGMGEEVEEAGATFYEGWAVECHRCHTKRDLAPDERPLLARDSPVAEMPRCVCGGCRMPLLIRWREVEVETAELVA